MMVGSEYQLNATELDNRKLRVVHAMTLGALSCCGFERVDPTWSGPNYRPHITHPDTGLALQEGSKLLANELSVFVKYKPASGQSRKTLVKRIPFSK